MANRSYLYACDDVPDGEAKLSPSGLSEYNYDVPLVHKLMIANAPRRVPSVIWDAEVGILADRAGAAERVIAFAEKLLEAPVSDRDELTTELADMKAVLAKTPPGKYYLLEIGEILEMQNGDPVKAVERLIKEIPDVVAKVDRAIAGKEDKWLAALRKTPIDELNFGAWSDVLYFSFEADGHEHGPGCDHDHDDEDDEDEVVVEVAAKPKAKQPAAKQAKKAKKGKKAKKPAAKKQPTTKKQPAAKKPAAKKKSR